MTRIAQSVLAVLGAAMAVVLAPVAQEPGTSMTIDVIVENGAGVPVHDLTAPDFEILSEGRRAPITSLAIDRKPLNIVLLVDLSASVTRRFGRDDVREETKDGIEGFFLRRLQEGERARIGGFASRLSLSRTFETDRRLLERALDAAFEHRRENIYGPSPIWDHAFTALEALADAVGRKVLVLFTDGRGTGNHRSIVEIVEHATRMGITMHLFGQDGETPIPQDANSLVIVNPGRQLEWIAEVTGGSYVEANVNRLPTKGLPDAGIKLQQLLGRLRSAYTIGFAPPFRDGKLHVLEVRVKRANLKIRAPRVFLASES